VETWGGGGCFPGDEAAGAWSWPPLSSAEVKNAWIYTSTPSYSFKRKFYLTHWIWGRWAVELVRSLSRRNRLHPCRESNPDPSIVQSPLLLLLLLFLVGWDWVHLILRPLLTPDDRWWWLWSSWRNEDWQGKPKYSEKTCPGATLPTTNPNDLTRARTRIAEVGSQLLTAWAMARPHPVTILTDLTASLNKS
jgi:hypothetical protein